MVWESSSLYFLLLLCSLSLSFVLFLSWLIFSIRRTSIQKIPTGMPLTEKIPVATMKNLTIKLYWMDYPDLPLLYMMERENGGNLYPCEFEDFQRSMCNGITAGVVAKDQDGKIRGYMIYAVRGKDTFIGSLVVSPEFRRHGLGSAILDWYFNQSPVTHRCPKVIVYARESALAWQQFLKANGFVCTQILDDLFIEPDETVYYFERPFYQEQLVTPQEEK